MSCRPCCPPRCSCLEIRILPPLLRLFNTLPPSFPAPLAPPMVHVIHTLITVPVTQSLRPKWLPHLSNPSTPKPSSKPISPTHSPPSPDSPTANAARADVSKHGAFDRAFSRLSVSRKNSGRSSSLQHPTDTLLRAHDLLDVTLSHYLPGDIDPDDVSVRERCQGESDSTLDELVCPLVLLITKLCTADEGCRKRMRDWLIPEDLDRTNPLEGRADLLGRCLRLLACIHHARLKDATGEMLFAMCDSDGGLLFFFYSWRSRS